MLHKKVFVLYYYAKNDKCLLYGLNMVYLCSMAIKHISFILLLALVSCKSKTEKTKPTTETISESIYASGIVKSKNQYQAVSTVNGIIETIYVTEGDSVKIGTPILLISNEAQRLNKNNALLASEYADVNENKGRLNEARLFIDLAKNKMKNDSLQFFRQKNLWQQKIGTQVELEQRELAYQNSKTNYFSSIEKYNELKRQIDFNSSQSKNNLLLSNKQENDFILKSEINGVVYSLPKNKGEMVGPQTPIAIIGDAKHFILEMQVDEYDILKIKKGLPVVVTFDSYKDQVFEAKISKINPIMNERSKTFLVEAEFVKQPETLYPNINFEASIVITTKSNALLIPRAYLYKDSIAIKSNGDSVKVKTGLKDYQKIEILSGINATDELIKP